MNVLLDIFFSRADFSELFFFKMADSMSVYDFYHQFFDSDNVSDNSFHGWQFEYQNLPTKCVNPKSFFLTKCANHNFSAKNSTDSFKIGIGATKSRQAK